MARLLWVAEGHSKVPSNGSIKTWVRRDTTLSNPEVRINRKTDAQGTTLCVCVYIYI